MTIHILDALAGSGKTRALARYSHHLAGVSHKVLFVQPTKHLITKTIADELQPLNPAYPVRAIHGDSRVSKSVIADIVDHFQKATLGRGEVLFITHAAFLLIPYIERKREWVLIVDEVPQVDQFFPLDVLDTQSVIIPHLALVPSGASYGRLVTREDALAAQGDAR